jgi:hypothetical protein
MTDEETVIGQKEESFFKSLDGFLYTAAVMVYSGHSGNDALYLPSGLTWSIYSNWQ